ncbi:MAG: hypothetical protein ACR2KV_15305 [Solirubrobacteraceae bacterium]
MVPRSAALLAVLASALLAAGCSDSSSLSGSTVKSTAISEATWHDGPWPFAVPSGVLACTQPPFPGAVTFKAAGPAYAVNNTAGDAGYRAIDPIRKRTAGGSPVSLRKMIDTGIALCPS